jgi:hypothetical protein
MSSKRLAITFVVICLLTWSTLSPALSLASPAAQAVCAGNVLLNPSFEEGFSDRGAGEVSVANGWHPWYQDGPGQVDGYNRRPEYKPENVALHTARRIHSGNFAQKFFNSFATHNGGILQQVQVPTGSKLTFSVWVQAWSSQQPNPDEVVSPGNYRVSVGIDPTGGTNGTSPNVVWSEPRMEYNTWMNLQVQSVAKAGTVTVFVRGNPEFRNRFNDSYWDDACLTVVRPASAPTSTPKPKDTPTPTPCPTPQASPTPTLIPTPLAGGVCVTSYEDANGNARRDEDERLIAGSVITLLDSARMELEKYTTDGLTEPYCFSGLAAGTYFLKRQNPVGYSSTVPDDWGIAVAPGMTTNLELGARLVPQPTALPTATPTRVPTPTPTPRPVLRETGRAIYQVSGIILAALALAMPLGLRYLRKHL